MTDAPVVSAPRNPADTLSGFEEWEHFVEERYRAPLEGQIVPPPMQRTMQRRDGYRDYRAEARPGVNECFRLNQIHQTLDLVKAKQKDFGRLNRKEMSAFPRELPSVDAVELDHAAAGAFHADADHLVAFAPERDDWLGMFGMCARRDHGGGRGPRVRG